MDIEPTVFVVDDDAGVRKGIKYLVESVHLKFAGYESAQDFLSKYQPDSVGCLILDIRMPGMGGLDLQREINKKKCTLPIIILTGHGDVSTSVTAFKAGAFDFIEKPPKDQILLETIQKAIRKSSEDHLEMQRKQILHDKLSLISDKAKVILKMIAAGNPNKKIAYELGLSEKTIEYHRAKIMKQLELTTAYELIKFAIESGIHK